MPGEAARRQRPNRGRGLFGAHQLQAVRRGRHGGGRHHVARPALGLGRVAQPRSQQNAVGRARDRDLDVEGVARFDRDLLGHGDRTVGVPEPHPPIRFLLHHEERIGDALGGLGVLAEVEAQRAGKLGRKHAHQIQRLLLFVEVLAQDEGLENRAPVGERGPEHVVGKGHGALRAGALGRGGGRLGGFGLRRSRSRRVRRGHRGLRRGGGRRSPRVGDTARRLGDDPLPEEQDAQRERGREEEAFFHGSWFLRHRVEAAPVERVAAGQSLHGQPPSAGEPMLLNRGRRVDRAGRLETAGPGQERGDPALVAREQRDCRPRRGTHQGAGCAAARDTARA